MEDQAHLTRGKRKNKSRVASPHEGQERKTQRRWRWRRRRGPEEEEEEGEGGSWKAVVSIVIESPMVGFMKCGLYLIQNQVSRVSLSFVWNGVLSLKGQCKELLNFKTRVFFTSLSSLVPRLSGNETTLSRAWERYIMMWTTFAARNHCRKRCS